MRSLLVTLAATLAFAHAAGAQQQPPRRIDLRQGQRADSTTSEPFEQSDEPSRRIRNAFVRNQTILGLTVYAPSFVAATADDGVTGAAAYLVMAGGSFFAAAELTRRLEITEARLLLSSAMAVRGAGTMLLLSLTSDASTRQTGAATLIGGLGGTAAGLALGRGLTGGQAAGMVFGHDLAVLSALAVTTAADPDRFDDRGLDDMTHAAVWTSAGIVGYTLGRRYVSTARHNVTAGDVQTLWLGTSIGALAGATAIVGSDPQAQTIALTLLAGGLLGTFAAERTLVRRFDHTRSEGNLLALGSGAGALMGIGVGLLVTGEADRGESLTLGFATLGAVAGVAMTERYLQPARDEGRLVGLSRLSVDPMGIVAVATGRPGRHGLLRFTF